MGPWLNGGRPQPRGRTSSLVARIERSEIRDQLFNTATQSPGFASAQPRATPPKFSRSLRNSCHRDRFGARLNRRRAVQVRLDGGGAGAEPGAVDLQILHDPLDVGARLAEPDALDPVDRIDLGIARIAFSEPRHYVQRVMENLQVYRD